MKIKIKMNLNKFYLIPWMKQKMKIQKFINKYQKKK